MKKIVLGAVLVLIACIGFGVYYLLSNLDSIVKSAIETYGSEATQTAVRVEGVEIKLQDGSAAIRGLTVGNPKGFEAAQAFSLGEIATQVDLDSLSQEVLVIKQISVTAPQVFFELNQAGDNNLEQLDKNLSAGSSGKSSTSPSAQEQSGAEPKLIIRKLSFTDGSIDATVAPAGKDYQLKLPNIVMTDLGGKNGATASQIAEQVLDRLIDKAMAEIQRQGIDQVKAQIEGEVMDRLGEEAEKLDKKTGGQLKELLNY